MTAGRGPMTSPVQGSNAMPIAPHRAVATLVQANPVILLSSPAPLRTRRRIQSLICRLETCGRVTFSGIFFSDFL